MPDPTKKTISASEAAALFNVSPYVTRWLLWQRFARDLDIDTPADARMDWGTKLEPLILDQASEDLRLEVRPNREASGAQQYFRNGYLGCHRDGDILCPDRGPGAIECKSLFDYKTWMADWNGGKQPPRHVEIQLQVQMYVGGGDANPFLWGVIAAWVAGEVHYFERKPIPEFLDHLHAAAKEFFVEVDEKREPNPFGVPAELPWLTKLFPTEKGNVLDLTDDPDGEKIVEAAVQYRDAKDQESGGKRAAEPLRARLLAVIKTHDEILLPAGVRIRISNSGPHKGKRIKVYVPDEASSARANPSFNPELIMAG